MAKQRNRRGSFFFYGLFVVLFVLVLYLLSPYLSIIAIALVTVVILKPLYDWFSRRKRIKGHTRIATTLTLLSFTLLIIIPIFIIGFLLFSQANDLLEELTSNEVELSLENLVAAL